MEKLTILEALKNNKGKIVFGKRLLVTKNDYKKTLKIWNSKSAFKNGKKLITIDLNLENLLILNEIINEFNMKVLANFDYKEFKDELEEVM